MIFEEIQHNIEKGIPFAIFRKPNEKPISYIKEESGERQFVFTSFDQEVNLKISFKEKKNVSFDSLKKLKLSEGAFKEDAISCVEYKNKVEHALSLIKEGVLEKVVLSRAILIEQKIDLLKTYKRLLENNSSAFCYIWFHPISGVWIGATPEILTQIKGLKLKTMSLAGTKTADQNWTIKEFEEQEVVSNYIESQLKIFSKEITIGKLETISSGKIEHLRTKISANLYTKNYEDVIRKIHPTPAVCGIPTQKAKTYLLEHENYNRQFYTGFLGELTSDNVELYVNLRCAKVSRNQVKLYVGGGINSMSNSEKEWKETELKAKIIQDCLQS